MTSLYIELWIVSVFKNKQINVPHLVSWDTLYTSLPTVPIRERVNYIWLLETSSHLHGFCIENLYIIYYYNNDRCCFYFDLFLTILNFLMLLLVFLLCYEIVPIRSIQTNVMSMTTNWQLLVFHSPRPQQTRQRFRLSIRPFKRRLWQKKNGNLFRENGVRLSNYCVWSTTHVTWKDTKIRQWLAGS